MFAIELHTIDEPRVYLHLRCITEQAIANHKPDPDAFLKEVRPTSVPSQVLQMCLFDMLIAYGRCT